MILLIAMVGLVFSSQIRVDATATGANNGSSWADAYNYLQDALAAATESDEIQVAEGTYKPDQGVGITLGERMATFQLKSGVVIRGGYAGFSETDPNARDIDAYKTILSGDLNSDDGTNFENYGDNSYHVMNGSGTDAATVFDGFIVTGGNAGEPYPKYPNDRGGGMFNYNGHATLANCIFSYNIAGYGGGGIWNYKGKLSLSNCRFYNNVSENRGGAIHNYEGTPNLVTCIFYRNSAYRGGGVHNDYSSPIFTECTFNENSTSERGGGIYSYNSHPIFTNCIFTFNSGTRGGGMVNDGGDSTLRKCTFSKNSATNYGGAMFHIRSEATLINCMFHRNSADDGGAMYNTKTSSHILIKCRFIENSSSNGGAIYNTYYSRPTLISCIISGNSAQDKGGAIFNMGLSNSTLINCTIVENRADNSVGGMLNDEGYKPSVTNSIFWGNIDSSGTGESAQIFGGTPAINYSCVQGWTSVLGGTGNIGDDPLFLEPDNEDPNNRDFHLVPHSLCIDTGDPNYEAEPNETDLDRNPRVINNRIDMGAYESNYIEVALKFTPQTLNPKSRGKWIKAHIVLPEGFEVENVDVNCPAKIWPLGIESEYINPFIDEDGLVEIEIGFERAAFCGVEIDNSPVEIIVIGTLTTGQDFYGIDTIRIIDKSLERIAFLSSRWLNSGCRKPDWCDGSDLNQDSIVNLVDFAFFAKYWLLEE